MISADELARFANDADYHVKLARLVERAGRRGKFAGGDGGRRWCGHSKRC